MDNLTHTLIGIAAVRAVPQKSKPQSIQRAVFWSVVLTSNVPDLDYIVSLFGEGQQQKLLTLLHHRGFTHTLVALPILGLICSWITCKFVKCRITLSIFFWACLGGLLHLFADSWNEYGIHPFSPFSNQWWYGDSVFILEPALWFVLLPVAWGEVKNRTARSVFVLAWAFGLTALWSGKFCPPSVAVGHTVWAIVSFLIYQMGNSTHKRGRPIWNLIAATCIVVLFFVSSRVVRSRVLAEMEPLRDPKEKQIELLVSPAPGNIFCWRTLVSFEFLGDYVVRGGVYSVLPNWFSARDCHFRAQALGTLSAPTQQSLWTSNDHVFWDWEYRSSLEIFQRLARQSADFKAFLGFARFPYWVEQVGNPEIRFGDLRYSRRKMGSFADFSFPSIGDQDPYPHWRGVMHPYLSPP